jgi:hypothetical protein
MADERNEIAYLVVAMLLLRGILEAIAKCARKGDGQLSKEG